MSTVRAKMRDIGGLRQDRDSEAIVYDFFPIPTLKRACHCPIGSGKKGKGCVATCEALALFGTTHPNHQRGMILDHAPLASAERGGGLGVPPNVAPQAH